MTPEEIRAALAAILPGVQKPGRYLALEANQVRKDWDAVAVRLLLAFPDEYGIGMSHQGTRILYHVANRRPDTLAERAFAPWPDMAAAMREHGVPLYALESCRPARDFDVVGITLQTELNFANVPYLLDLAGIPRLAADRGEDAPLVVGGGPCMANPEPLADFFDAFAIGDGEALLPPLLDIVGEAKTASLPRLDLLRRLATVPGWYVPRFYRWTPADRTAAGGTWETREPGVPARVRRAFVARLDPADVPVTPLVPAIEVVQARLGMEIVRGCTQGCRFCQAGFWYRPIREHDPATVVATLEAHVAATGYEEVGLLSLSSADYSQIEPLAHRLASRLAPRRVSVSLPSLRADAFSVALAESVSRVRKSGFTFAPETGSDRLRRVINKTFTNADMVAAAEVAFARGWNLIKVYAMIGLPTETDDDLEELARLAEEILAAARRAGNRRAEVKVSVGPYVPKPWTPFQWEGFVPPEEMQRRIDLLRDRFRRIRHATLTWGEPSEARLESLLSRGDRRLGAVIARAHDLGAQFDGWHEFANLAAWDEAVREAGLDWDAETGPREFAATLPWEIVAAGVRTSYLRAEQRRALQELPSPDCRWGSCLHCGIPGDGADIDLAAASLEAGGDDEVDPALGRDAAYRLRPTPRVVPPPPPLAQPERTARARATFAKRGDARWLSHRNVMDLIERALRAAAWPVRFTEGFNPHIRVSMGPALPLGVEALQEYFEVDLHAPVEPGMLSRANRVLPPGLALTAVAMVPQDAPSLGKEIAAARLRISPVGNAPAWPAAPPHLDGLLDWQIDGDDLVVVLNARQVDGPMPSARDVLAAAGVPLDAVPRLAIVREALLLEAGAAGRRS